MKILWIDLAYSKQLLHLKDNTLDHYEMVAVALRKMHIRVDSI